MTDTVQWLLTLKKLPKAQGLTYAAVAQRIGLSEASVKRLFSARTFTLARLESFCRILDIDFFDLAKLARGRADDVREMTERQEAVLAKDARLLRVFYLLLSDWTAAEIFAAYQVTRPELTRLLVRLDRLRLIDLLPHDHARVKVPKSLRLRPGGPIHRVHGSASSTTSSPRNSPGKATSDSSIASCRRRRTRRSRSGSSASPRSSSRLPSSTARCPRNSARASACCWRCGRGRCRW